MLALAVYVIFYSKEHAAALSSQEALLQGAHTLLDSALQRAKDAELAVITEREQNNLVKVMTVKKDIDNYLQNHKSVIAG